MPLPPLTGHERVKTKLAGAHASGKLPQALLLAGPRGVGKQRLALWLAQLIHCEAPGQEPCGQCRPCRLVVSLQHPDVHWFVPVELSKRGGTSTGDAEKQVDLVADALAEEMTARREQPLYAPVVGLASHPVASVRLLLKRLALTPAMGKQKVFIVGDAERLIPQLGTEVAANALLKALEEPPADSVIIITAADPNALLPTIMSRVVLVRVARIADSDVTAFAQQTLGIRSKAGRGDRPGDGRARSRAGQCEPAALGCRIGRGPAGDETVMKLSHLNQAGRARMVDVGDKPMMDRSAVATGTIRMSPEAFRLVAEQAIAKGDVLAVSEVAGTLAAKRTAELIPLCHPLGLDHVEVEASLAEALPGVRISAKVRTVGRTGVEMEALTAVTVALLTIYDMVKAVDSGMVIGDVQLVEKQKAPRVG